LENFVDDIAILQEKKIKLNTIEVTPDCGSITISIGTK
jgi:hypothetical protein